MDREELIGELHPDYLEARDLIERHGVGRGTQEHTSGQLVGACWVRGWSWKVNEDRPGWLRSGDYVELRKTYGPVRGSGSHSISRWGDGVVVALTLALAWAIKEDDDRYRCGQVQVAAKPAGQPRRVGHGRPGRLTWTPSSARQWST